MLHVLHATRGLASATHLDVGLGVDHVELHPPGDGAGGGGHLALVDAAVSVLDKLDLVRVGISC